MTLNEIKFDTLDAISMRGIDFAKKGNSAVIRRLNLYPMEIITGAAQLQGFYIEVERNDYFTDYTVWNDCDGILAVKYFKLRDEMDILTVSEIMARNLSFKGLDGYKRLLSQKEQKGAFINIVEITALIKLGDTALAAHYNSYRDNYLMQQEEEERKKEIQRQIEQQKEDKRAQEALEEKIREAEECIRTNKLIQNDLLDTGNHIILHLMKKHSISVSLKTQGWINNKLTSVVFCKDNSISVYFLKGKGCKCPQSIYNYLGLLKEAVNAAV